MSIELAGLIYSDQLDFRWPDDILEGKGQDDFYERSLLGAVVEALAEKWKVPEDAIWDEMDLPDGEDEHWIVRRVGTVGKDPFVTSLSARILKPK